MLNKIQKNTLFVLLSIIIIISLILGIYFGVKNNSNNTNNTNNSNNNQGNSGNRMIGYYQQTATVNNCTGIQGMTPEFIPAQYYTHLIFGFAPPIDTNSWELKDPMDDLVRYNSFNNLKTKYTKLKTMLSIGGDLMSVSPMSQMASNDVNRLHFVKTSINFVKKYGFDGIDIDWEYPNDVSRGGQYVDPDNFVKLLKDFRTEIDKDSSKLLLTAALPGGPFWGVGYKVSESIQYVDWFNIMAYNVLGTWNGQAACSSPIQTINSTSDSVDKAVEFFMSGQDPKKFNLGMSLWGITFTLIDSSQNTFGSPTYKDRTTTLGYCTKQTGYLSYFEIQEILVGNNVTVKPQFNEKGICEYFVYNSDQFVGYDDTNSFSKKMDYYKSKNFGGVSIWGMDSDIPSTFPLTKLINSKI